MARLPTLDDLGARPTPVSNRRIISDPSAGVVGQALEGFGQTATKVGQAFQEREDRLSYAAAKAALLKADVATRQELQDDPNYETWGARYTEKMKAAREAASQMIGSHADRRLFEADAELDVVRGGAELGKLATAKRVNARQATLDQGLIDLQDVGINAPDDATREATLGTANDMINAAVKDGTVDATRAVEMRRTFTQNYVMQRAEALRTIGDLDGAQKWLDANRSRLDPGAEMRLSTQLFDARQNRENLTIAEEIVHGGGQPAPVGLVTPGNIDIHNRPVVKNRDGSISTVRTISIGTDQGEVLIPTVVGGKVVSDAEAIAEYQRTGQHLGIFKDAASATAYAKALHEQQAQEYGGARAPMLSQMVPITVNSESAGNPNAVSPKGARGLMQIMPATGRDPGFGIRPTDGSSADNVRFGTEYLGKMMERYDNDPAKAWAAYNAGPGRLDDAIKDHGANWLSAMPGETQAYVAKNMAALGRGATQTPAEHDLNRIYGSIDERARREGWTPERTEVVKAQAAKLVDRDEGLLRRQQADAFDSALAKADALGAGFTDVSQLGDAFYRASPADQHRLRAMAQANAAPKEPEANGAVIRSLHVMAIEAPDKLAQANLAQYKPFMTAAEFDEISQAQARAKTDAGPNAWNPRTGIQAAIGWGKTFGGVDVKGEDLYRVYRYMEARAREQSAQTGGKPPTENDYQSFFREATREVQVRRSFMGIDALAPDTTQRAYQLPSAPYKAVITRQFRAQFGRNPTDAEVQQWFDRMGEALK